MSRTRLPLIFSIAGHTIPLAVLILLVAEPSPPELPVRGRYRRRLGPVYRKRRRSSPPKRRADAGIDQMMGGSQLPAFPTDMTAFQIEVSVTIRFNLTR
jgi:hypothetical protein